MTPHFLVMVALIGAGSAGLVAASVFWTMRNGGHLTRLLVRALVLLSLVTIDNVSRVYLWDEMDTFDRVRFAVFACFLIGGSIDAVTTLLREMRGTKLEKKH